MVVKPVWTHHRFSREIIPDRRHGGAELERRLRELGVPFTRRELALRLDQPLKSVEDGLRFFRLYSKDTDPADITEDFVRTRLEPQDDPRYPYRLPVDRTVAILIFDAKDIPPETERSLDP